MLIMGVGLVRSLQPPDILWIHWRVYNSIANSFYPLLTSMSEAQQQSDGRDALGKAGGGVVLNSGASLPLEVGWGKGCVTLPLK